MGTVGLDWQLGGFAPTASNGFIDNSGGPLASGPQPPAGSTSQLVQAMAGFGGSSGAADGLNTVPLDTSQQQFLTTRIGQAAVRDVTEPRSWAIFGYAVRLLVSAVTEAVFLPSSAAAIRPAIASDARRSGSLSRCA